MTGQVHSEFCSWVSDDDFPVVSNLLQAVGDLADSGASGWMGEIFDFNVVGLPPRAKGSLRIEPRGRDCSGRYTFRRGVAGSFSERLSQSIHLVSWGAVTRTEVVRGAVKALQKAGADPWWLEQLMIYQLVLFGTVLNSSTVSQFRQDNTPGSYGGIDRGDVFDEQNLAVVRRAISLLITPQGLARDWQTEIVRHYSGLMEQRRLRRLESSRRFILHGRFRRLGKRARRFLNETFVTKRTLDQGFESVREDLSAGDQYAVNSLDVMRDVVARVRRSD